MKTKITVFTFGSRERCVKSVFFVIRILLICLLRYNICVQNGG